MKPTNRLLRIMLETEILFDCDKCKRYWLFREYKQHTERRQCIADPNAPNNIEKIKQPITAAEQKKIDDNELARKLSITAASSG